MGLLTKKRRTCIVASLLRYLKSCFLLPADTGYIICSYSGILQLWKSLTRSMTLQKNSPFLCLCLLLLWWKSKLWFLLWDANNLRRGNYILYIYIELHHSSHQCQILNPLSKARDQTLILMDTSQIHFYWATTGTPYSIFLCYNVS